MGTANVSVLQVQMKQDHNNEVMHVMWKTFATLANKTEM